MGKSDYYYSSSDDSKIDHAIHKLEDKIEDAVEDAVELMEAVHDALHEDDKPCTYLKWDKWKIGGHFAALATTAGVCGSFLFGMTIGFLNASQDWIGSELWPCDPVSFPANEAEWLNPSSWSTMAVSKECWDVMLADPDFDIATNCNSGLDDKITQCGDCIAPSVKSCDQWTWWMAILSCSVLVGAAVATGMGSVLLKMSIQANNWIAMIIFGVGAACTVCSGSIASLVMSRVISGFALGMTSMYPPMWIAQMTPLHKKGMYGVMHQLFITIGILIGPLLGLGFGAGPFLQKFTYNEIDSTPTEFTVIYWRCLFGVGYFILIGMTAVLFLYMDMDTPSEYINKGCYKDAKEGLKRIYKCHDFEDCRQYYEDIFKGIEAGKAARASGLTFGKACSNKEYRWMIFVGCMCSAIQQLSGINVFVTASNQLFAQAGVAPSLVTTMSIVMTALNVIMTFPAIPLIELLGRKSLMLYGIIGQCIGALLPTIGQWAAPTESWSEIMSIVGIMLLVCSFSVSMGPVLWVWFTEIFPPDVNLAASSALVATNWITGIVMVFVGTAITDNTILFTLFLALNIYSFIFVLLFCKETKGLPSGVSPFLITKDEYKEYMQQYVARKAEMKKHK